MGLFSKLFSKRPDPINEAMQMIRRILDDEEFQTGMYPPEFKSLLLEGEACDVISNAIGEFGFDITNPIPVNGALGGMAYLSKLDSPTGEKILFHRLGAAGTIDAFECVTFSGSEWYILYLDMYHPRKSQVAPKGFTISKGLRQLSGFHNFCSDFPYDFMQKKQAERETGLSIAYIAVDNIINQIKDRVYERPLDHIDRVNTIKKILTSFSA